MNFLEEDYQLKRGICSAGILTRTGRHNHRELELVHAEVCVIPRVRKTKTGQKKMIFTGGLHDAGTVYFKGKNAVPFYSIRSRGTTPKKGGFQRQEAESQP